nr:MAG TPA: hypothetical protein [Caudoviricetes sp.]
MTICVYKLFSLNIIEICTGFGVYPRKGLIDVYR